jgi:penicillin-binding protein 2
MPSRHVHVVPREVSPELQLRMAVAVGVVFVAFTLVGARLWYLQVERGEEMRLLSESNRVRRVRIAAARGIVYDRFGEILVDNRPSFDMILVPEDARDRQQVFRNLAGYLGEAEAELHEMARAPSKRPPYEGIVLRRDVGWEAVMAVETHQLDLPGVSVQVGPKRSYPFGPLAAHLLGYVGEVSQADLADAARGYWPGDVVGKAGLERAWEGELRGTRGGQQVEVDALGRRVRVLQEVADVPGNSLILTLDRDLQDVAERTLGDRKGSIVALDPRNGEILVMVSRPAFDPNLFARGIRREEWQALVQDRSHPLNNRAVQGVFPPGSTFKIAVAAGALEESVVTPFTSVTCGGGTQFGRRFFRCWKKGGHGRMQLHDAVVQSCDVFFYEVGQRLGVDGIAEFARRFGLGLATGVRLQHESAGTIPDREWKRRRFDEPWYPGETLSVAIGQGYVTATPLQMANFVATVANGGTRYRPHYVKRVEAFDGTVREEIAPEIVAQAHLKTSTITQLQSAMRDVVMSTRGTGQKARVLGVEVAGKTGTSQVVRLSRREETGDVAETRDHAWFMAYAPVEAPEIAIAAIVEHAEGGGGAIAAPIVQRILAHYFTRTQGPPRPADLPAQQVDAPAPAPREAHAVRPTADHTL